MQRIHIREELPPLNDLGGVGQAVGRFLRDNQIWKDLKEEAIAEKQQLTPYSFRHRFAYVGHNGRNTKAIQDTFYKLLSDEYQDKAPALGFVPLKGEILKKSIRAVGRIGR